MENRAINANISIYATPATVWDVLTNPAKIIRYLGSHTSSDWVVGSPITWEGEMQGMKYLNKGKVLESSPNELLKFTYWSGMGGDPDEEQNYSVISYKLLDQGDGRTELTYHREKIPTEMEQMVFEAQLPAMLQEIKKIAEGKD